MVSRGRRALLLGLFACLTVWGQRLDRGRAARLLQRPHAEGQFIVKFREAAPEAEDLGRYSAGGVRGMERVGGVHLVRTNGRGAAVLQALSEHPEVEYVEPDYLITVNKTPNDAMFGQQWGLKNTVMVGADVSAPAAWDYSTGGRKTVVPVCGMLSSAWWLGEPLPMWKLEAAALVIAGLALNVFGPRWWRGTPVAKPARVRI
jgi:hypothetical protein